MEPRISLITLGVRELARAVRFYHDGLRWPLSSASTAEVAFFLTGGTVLALYPRDLLAEDAGLAVDGTGFGGITLAHNVSSRDGVDEALARAYAAGARILKPATDASWGGYHGYFADLDGYPWEVAWAPMFEFAADGALLLPA